MTLHDVRMTAWQHNQVSWKADFSGTECHAAEIKCYYILFGDDHMTPGSDIGDQRGKLKTHFKLDPFIKILKMYNDSNFCVSFIVNYPIHKILYCKW